MPIIIPKRRQSVADEYRTFARAADPRAVNGRHQLHDLTRGIVEATLPLLDVAPDHRVLDVGCGDGTMLRGIGPVAKAVGTVLTEEERARLAPTFAAAGMQLFAASFDDLSPVAGPFDWIICNGAISLAKSPRGGRRALQNFVALLAPGGRIWLGEVYGKNNRPQRRYASKLRALNYVRRRHGGAFALRFAWHIARRWRRAALIVERGPERWFVTERELAALAVEVGLSVVETWDCQAMTGNPFYWWRQRYSALLIKTP